MANSADPDQLASSEVNWSWSTLFANAGYIWVQQDKDLNCFASLLKIFISKRNKRKEFAPRGSEFFYKPNPFLEWIWYAGKQTGSHKSCLPCKK